MEDAVANNYNDERFKYTFRRKTINYILEKILGGLQKEIVTKLPISPKMRLAICL